jgi:hypothetical protein
MKTNLGSVAAIFLAAGCMYFVEMNSAVKGNKKSTETTKWNSPNSPMGLAVSKQSQTKRTLTDVIRSMEPTAQKFTVFSGDTTFLQGREGTFLVLPPHLFETPSGKTPDGPVEISLIECYSVPTIISKELSTTSGDKLLETAGMIHITATYNGEKLVIRDGKNYQIQFPQRQKKDFTLFVGERQPSGVMDWKLNAADGTPVALPSAKYTTNIPNNFQEKVGDFVEITHSYMLGSVGKITKEDHFMWNLANGQSLNEYYLSNANPPLEMVKEFCDDNLSCEITFKVNKDGEVIQTYVSKRTNTRWDEWLNTFVKNLPSINIDELMPVYTDDHACKLQFGEGRKIQTQNFTTQFRSQNNWEEGATLDEVNKNQLLYYTYNTSTLGWINCDRFAEYNPEQLVDVSVQTLYPDSCNFNLIFDDLYSVLKAQRFGNTFTFTGVPQGERVTVVGIQCINGQASMFTETFTVPRPGATISATDFQPFTLKELDYTFSAKRLEI